MNFLIQYLIKFLIIVVAFAMGILATFAAVLLPAGICFYLLFNVNSLWLFNIPLVVCVLPVLCMWSYASFIAILYRERLLAEKVGPGAALWHEAGQSWNLNLSNGLHLLKISHRAIVLAGWDWSGPVLKAHFEALQLPSSWCEEAENGVLHGGSLLYSWTIDALWNIFSPTSTSLVGTFVFASIVYRVLKTGYKISKFAIWCFVTCMCILVALPAHFHVSLFKFVLQLTYFVLNMRFTGEDGLFVWLQWRLTYLVVIMVSQLEAVNSEFEAYSSVKVSAGRAKLGGHFRLAVIQAVAFISDMRLPNYIRSAGWSQPTVEKLSESIDKMKEAGWPINVEITQPSEFSQNQPFKEWVLCGTDFATGIKNLKTAVDEELNSLRVGAVIYRRTEDYRDLESELEATSRYFRSPTYDFPDLAIDDVWFVVGDIFRHSRLTPFNYIIWAWEKKYALGSFMKDPRGNFKYKRSKFIRDIGGMQPFKALWRKTFEIAAGIVPTAHVSVKDEALPPKKWQQKMVRTVIGSPITQYILSTVWNYHPNHNFKWQSTPIKVGMPLNGKWISNIFDRHSRCQIHVEGDFTAFDSTIDKHVQDIVASIRKKGFENHKDARRIADLIDINYHQVNSQLLNLTTTGDVYKKGTGMTTGHSSTSMDNSVALVVYYLMAWKELTGLSAREFMHYNELSCYGDDHMLSYLSSRPLAWTHSNIANVMKRWGVINNVKEMKLQDMKFLNKTVRRPTVSEVSWLATIGVDAPSWIVVHDRKSLVGKLTAPIKNVTDNAYRLKRLISYLSLTAHHKDVYNGIVSAIHGSRSMSSVLKNNKWKIPSYEEVVIAWYNNGTDHQVLDRIEGDISEDLINRAYVGYGQVTFYDRTLAILSLVPDLLNPVTFNYGYVRTVQAFLSPHIVWVTDLIAMQNGCRENTALRYCLQRTPYRWFDCDVSSPGKSSADPSSLLVRHWLYIVYCHFRKKFRFDPMFSFVSRKVSNLQFVLNARLHSESKSSTIALDLLIVAALLDWVHLPVIFTPIASIPIPDVGAMVDSIVHFCFVAVWASVPPNYAEFERLIKPRVHTGVKIIVDAPTGTGKSTQLPMHICHRLGHQYRKVVMIEPRTILVRGLVDYMKRITPIHVSGSTTGMQLDRSAKLWYVTAQSFFLLMGELSPKDLIVLDEAHLNEPAYRFLVSALQSFKNDVLFVTATPTPPLKAGVPLTISLGTAQLFHTTNDVSVLPGLVSESSAPQVMSLWKKHVRDMLSVAPAKKRILVFVNTPKQVSDFVAACPRPAVGLSGLHPVPDNWDCNTYISTSVADVGLTIPGLDEVWTLDVVRGPEEATLSMLDSATLKQRKGRVGRTKNGHTRCYVVSNFVKIVETSRENSTQDYGSLLAGGLPPELLARVNRPMFLSCLGLSDVPLTEEQVNDIVLASHAWVTNLHAEALTIAAEGNSLDGEGIRVTHTGSGFLYGFDGHSSRFEGNLIDSLKGLVHQALGLETPKDVWESSLRFLHSLPGPTYAVRNLAMRIIGDIGDWELPAPNPLFQSSPLQDIRALLDIQELLQEATEL